LADIVEMPGGIMPSAAGILDVYPLSRAPPLRIELFGDEVESIRKFDPHNPAFSHAAVDEIKFPASPKRRQRGNCSFIHARLSGQTHFPARQDIVEQAARAEGVTMFSRMEFYAPIAGG